MAAASGAKSTMMYRNKPHKNLDWSNCIHFISGTTKSVDGTCTVVDGSISPQGWCIVYVQKS
jgi:hypothetical protein